MAKLPYFPFYPGDWLKEPHLRRCSKAAKGVFVDMLCLMFECPDRGVLSTGDRPWSDEEISAAVGGDIAENLRCVVELCEKGVVSRNGLGAIFSRRMVRDETNRRQNAERQGRSRNANSNGRSNGRSNGHVTPLEYESEDEGLQKLREIAKREGISEDDADALFWKWHENEWTRNNGRDRIRDVRLTLLSWRKQGYLPSQKNGATINGHAPKRQMSAFEIEKRIEAITGTLNKFYREAGIARGGTYTDNQQREVDQLKAAKDELKRQLARA